MVTEKTGDAGVVKAKSTLKLSEKLGYGGGGLFVYCFYLQFQAYYMMIFLTDVLGFNAYIAATIYTATQIIKVITMIVGGTVIDSTNLKLGKYRSWILIGAILVSIFSVLMFWKFNIPTVAAVALFVIVYIIQSFGYNIMWTANRAMVGPMSKTSDDAVSLAGVAQAASTLGGIVYGLIGVPLLTAFSSTGQGYGLTEMVYSVLILLGTAVMMAVTKKYDRPQTEKDADVVKSSKKAGRVSFGTMLKSLRGPMIPYFFAFTLGTAQQGFFFALLTYFTTYVLNNPQVMGYALTCYSVAGFFGALLARPLCAKFNKKAVYIAATAASAVLYFLIRVIGGQAAGFLVIYTCIGFIGSFAGVLLPAFANDLADYQEMKTGEASARAFVQSIAGVTIRLGGLISTSIAAFGLASIGYQKGVEMTDSMLSSITNLMAVGPALFCAAAVIVFLFYHVSESELDEFRAKKVAAAEAAKANS